MKFFILFALVALCHSYPYSTYSTRGRNVNISEDGTIVITAASGKQVIISKGMGASGQKNIDITVTGPGIPTKRIHIDDQGESGKVNSLFGNQLSDTSDEYQRDKRSSKKRSQGDTLAEILGQYQGVVDDIAYQQLLKKVSSAVRSGLLNQSVYDVLQYLDQQGQYNPVLGPVVGAQSPSVALLELLENQQAMGGVQFQGVPSSMYNQLQYGQGISQGTRGIAGTPGVVLRVPVQTSQGPIVERMSLPVGGLISGSAGIGGIASPARQASIWRYLLNQQPTGISAAYGQQGPLSQIMDTQWDILGQQDQIQQQQTQNQQLQLQQQQQILQQQQQEQELAQQLQQLQQQQQQLRQQQQLQQQILQQQQYNPLATSYLLNRPVSAVNPAGWNMAQQLGAIPERGLVGGATWRIPMRGGVPLVL